MKLHNEKLTKRFLWGTLLGVGFGLLCFTGFSSQSGFPAEIARWQVWSWSNPWMWGTIINRMVLGIVVAMSGFVVAQPLLGFKISPWMRGAKMGFLVSLPMAIGSLQSANSEVAWNGFWIVLIAGTIIGLIIDVIITKLSGEGKELMDN